MVGKNKAGQVILQQSSVMLHSLELLVVQIMRLFIQKYVMLQNKAYKYITKEQLPMSNVQRVLMLTVRSIGMLAVINEQ